MTTKAQACSKIVLTVAACLIASAPSAAFAADPAPLYSCINTKKGAIVNRPKCLRGETRFSRTTYTRRINSVDKKVTSVEADVANLQASLDAIPQPARILNVATSGTAYQTIASALLTATQLSPTAANPVLVKVAPGTFALPTSGATVPSHVLLEGSGAGITKVTVTGAHGITLSNLSRLSQLTVHTSGSTMRKLVSFEAAGGAAFIEDLSLEATTSGSIPDILGVEVNNGILYANRVRLNINDTSTTGGIRAITISGLTSKVEANQFDIAITSASAPSVRGWEVENGGGATIRDSAVRVAAFGGGIATPIRIGGTSQSVLIQNVRATNEHSASNDVLYVSQASGAVIENSSLESSDTVDGFGNGVVIADSGAAIEIRNSSVVTQAGYTGISAYDPGSSVKVMSTFISAGAGATSGGATVTCAGVTDEAYVFYASTCPS